MIQEFEITQIDEKLEELNQKHIQLNKQINDLLKRRVELKQQTKVKEDNLKKVKELPQHYVVLTNRWYTTIGFCTNIDISADTCFIDFNDKVISISIINGISFQKDRININLTEPLTTKNITKQQFDDIVSQYKKTMDMVGEL